jgi:TetR/AcrR family transcriptional regulator, transcriptional repressor for nem operon
MARQREFDRETALDRAMAAFWSKGYGATSIEDLVAHMGIQRGSLYGTFGDKRTLFLAVLDRYQRVVARELVEALDAPGSGIEAIRQFFRLRVEGSLDRRRPPGCLVTNSAVELSGRDRGAAAMVGGSLAKIEAAFLRALARFLTSSAQGLSVMARAARDRAALEDVVDVILSVLESGQPGSRRPRRAKAVTA